MDIPLEDIVLIESDIKVVFYQRRFDQYSFEVCLILSDGQNKIGKYVYFENEKEVVIDDSLVFY